MTNECRVGRRPATAAALLCAVLVAGACGTRASEADQLAARGLAEPRATATVTDPSPAPGGALPAAGPGVVPAPTEVAGTGSPAVSGSGTPAPSGSGAGGTEVGPGAQPAAGAATSSKPVRAGAGSAPGAGTATTGAAPAEPRPATAGPGATPAPAAGGAKAPVTIGSVGALSGPAASGCLPALGGVQVWVQSVNAKGGASGHPVKFLSADDNMDGARHRQLVQEFVEQKGVIAFVQNCEALTGAGSVDYLTKKMVPVINSEGAGDWFYKSPAYFPVGSHGDPLIKAGLYNTAGYAKTKNVKRFGIIACTEAQICTDSIRLNGNAENARAAGLELVYTARSSLAQPDFTAECIGARNAGVEILQVVLDGNAVGRVAASCSRQNYKPLISVFAAIAFDEMKSNPDLDGMTVNANSFPYFLCDGAAAEYCAALKRFGPVQFYGIGTSNGWSAGKVFERALQNAPDQVTSAAVLEGLWGFKDETLGGITQPLTFTKGQNAPRTACWWPLVIQTKQFVASSAMTVRCV